MESLAVNQCFDLQKHLLFYHIVLLTIFKIIFDDDPTVRMSRFIYFDDIKKFSEKNNFIWMESLAINYWYDLYQHLVFYHVLQFSFFKKYFWMIQPYGCEDLYILMVFKKFQKKKIWMESLAVNQWFDLYQHRVFYHVLQLILF